MRNVTESQDLKLLIRESLLEAGFREFDRSDWETFNAAESFTSVFEPIIKDEDEMCVIFDNSGFHSYYDHPMDHVSVGLMFRETKGCVVVLE